MSDWLKRMDRRQVEWAVKELRERDTLDRIKGISPDMDRRIRNAERRIARKEKS
jgi:hypothetical protein